MRKPELEQFKQIWLTSKAYELLRLAKRKEEKSMARIVDDLIKDKYIGAKKLTDVTKV